MEYTMSCDDGFVIKSSSKEEVANLAGMHVMMMHPGEMISGKDMMKKVKATKKGMSMEM